MKTIRFCVALFGLLLTTLMVRSQTYSIPWAQQQPAWVFPLWFEDGSGQRDTLYYCYDPNALNIPWDTIFGEGLIIEDAQAFNMTFGSGLVNDSVHLKAAVLHQPQANFLAPVSIYPYNFTMPLTIRYDVNLFRNDSLPFTDQDPAPRVEALLWYDLPMMTDGCWPSEPIVITDTATSIPCPRPDSVTFTGPGFSYLTFELRSWTGLYLFVNSLPQVQDVVINPNPASNELHVSILGESDINRLISVQDLTGKLLLEQKCQNAVTIDVRAWPAGLYICRVESKTQTSFSKILIQH